MRRIQVFLCALCSMSHLINAQPIHFSLTPSGKVGLDKSTQICIEGLEPRQIVELSAQAEDQRGEVWASQAYFRADDDGTIDLCRDEPLSGSSYDIVDEMGLFWSMVPPSGDSSVSFKCKQDCFVAELVLRSEGQILGKEGVSRFLQLSEVKRIDIQGQGLVGVLFLPPSKGPLPVIITLSGSNGGISESRAKLLSSHGFAVLALGVFGVEGLPANLQEIPFEYFEKMFSWLKGNKEIDASRIGIYGVSRGAELALLLGSYFPESVHAIVAVAPSSVVYGGLSDVPVDAWVYRGLPLLPFAPVAQASFEEGMGSSVDTPANTRRSFIEGMQQTEAFRAAVIPVENIQCPLLLISGGDDQMWPSDLYAEQILIRLKEHHSAIVCEHLHYPLAGHGINLPNLPIPGPVYYHPIAKQWFSMGGSRSADAWASRDSWDKLVNFFYQQLNTEE